MELIKFQDPCGFINFIVTAMVKNYAKFDNVVEIWLNLAPQRKFGACDSWNLHRGLVLQIETGSLYVYQEM